MHHRLGMHDKGEARRGVQRTWQDTLGQCIPGLLSEEGPLAEEVCFEEAVDRLHALRCGLVHHCLAFLHYVELVACLSLYAPPIMSSLFALLYHKPGRHITKASFFSYNRRVPTLVNFSWHVISVRIWYRNLSSILRQSGTWHSEGPQVVRLHLLWRSLPG